MCFARNLFTEIALLLGCAIVTLIGQTGITFELISVKSTCQFTGTIKTITEISENTPTDFSGRNLTSN